MSLHGRKHIIIGIPTLGVVSTRWALAYAALATPMNTVVARIIKEGLPVDQARNDIVAKTLALDGQPTHLMWLDDDVIPHPHCLLQLLRAGRDIVSGVYFTKSEESEPLIFATPGHGTLEYVPGSGLHRVWGHGSGLTLVRTDVYRRMQPMDLGTDLRGNPRWYYTSGDQPGEGLRCTEDLWFCMKAAEAGYSCWVDMHPFALGWHYCYRRKTGYPEKQWRQFLETGEASFDVSDEGMVAAGFEDGHKLMALVRDQGLEMAEVNP
jgi:hypothetical protein